MTDVCPICKTERAEGEPSCHICGHRNPAPDPGNAPTRQQPSLTGMRTVQRVNVSTFLILELAPLGIALLAAWAFMAQGAASSGGTYIEVFGQRRVFSASGGNASGIYAQGALIVACALTSLITSLVLLAKAWGSIDDGRAPVSMTWSVLLVLIPFVNVIGVFFSYGRLPSACWEFADRHELKPLELSPWVFVLYSLCYAVRWFPVKITSWGPTSTIEGIAGLGLLVLGIVITVQLCRAINVVAEAQKAARCMNSTSGAQQ
ncbi:MAG TPA: hypothetical protein QGH10_04155 [Armatimonadota bacterium]|nr:hypothetical protein [Armatimonadota bacterium]